MVALYFDVAFLNEFERREDKFDSIVYDFSTQFLKSIRGVEVYLNLDSLEQLQKLINTSEVYWELTEINSPKILNFMEELSNPEFFRQGKIAKLFFVENIDEEKLQEESGYYFISNQTLKEKWKLFLSNREDSQLLVKSDPGLDEAGIFRTWSDLNLFKHKIKNILVFDLFAMANKKNQRVKDNLLPCISQLIKNTKGGSDELTIFTKDLGQNIKNFWVENDVNALSEQLKPIHTRIKTISFVKYDGTKNFITDKEHNRCILTNYFYIRFPAGINIFKENSKVNHRDEIHFDSILKNRTRKFVTEFISNLKKYTLQLKEKDTGVDNSGKVIEHYYYYPKLECSFLR